MKFSSTAEHEMIALGESLADRFRAGGVVYLRGDLGAGKTTLVRGILRGLGFPGRVKSPSFALMESYPMDDLDVHHLDLYRLSDPAELEFIGVEDLLEDRTLLLIEWPERGEGWLPEQDLDITIEIAGQSRQIELHRPEHRK